MIKLKDLISEDYDSQMRRKYRGNYTDVQVQDVHFQTDSDPEMIGVRMTPVSG